MGDNFYQTSEASSVNASSGSSAAKNISKTNINDLTLGKGGVKNTTNFDFVEFAITYLLPLGVFVLACFLVFLGVKTAIHLIKLNAFNKAKVKKWKDSVIMEVAVPKDTAEQAQKEFGSSAQKDAKDGLGFGEQIFSILSNYNQKQNKWNIFKNDRESFSFEIVNVDSEIRFWIVASNKTADVLKKQVIALYPKAHIYIVDQTNFFKEGHVSFCKELVLNNIQELPFKTYKLMDSDPLNNLTSALSSVSKDCSAAIQLIVEPIINKEWQKKSQLFALKIQQGQNPKDILFSKKKNPIIGIARDVLKAFGSIGKDLIKGLRGDDDKKEDKNPFGEKDKKREIDLSGQKVQIQLTPQQNEIVKKLEEKASKPGFKFTLRIIATGKTEAEAKRFVENIVPTFQIYDIKPFNGFKVKKTKKDKAVLDYLLRAPNYKNKQIINTEELTSIWHIPSWQITTPGIKWLLGRRLPLPLYVPEKSDRRVYVGRAASGGVTKDIYMETEDRFRHIYSLGGTGSGKTVTMNNIALQDIKMGHGVCIVDPHGESIDDILRRLPKERIKDVIVFSPTFTDRPLALNMLEYDRLKPTQRTLVIDTLFDIWDKMYDLKKSGGPMFENYMKNAIRLVMSHEESGSTLLEIPKILADDDYRAFKLGMCEDQEVKDFWEKQAVKAGGEASLENVVPYITAKLSPFVNNDFVRPMIGQQKSVLNFREAMDNNKIVLVSLAKGIIGTQAAYLIGMVLIGGLLNAGMGRSDGLRYNLDGTTENIHPSERRPFFIYIDEMQNFLFDAIPKALEEVRKYKIGFYLAHQFIKQVVVDGSERIKDSIMANCGSKFIFRCGSDDAKYLESEFYPLSPADIQNPEKQTFNAIVLINAQKSTPFNVGAIYNEYFEIEKDKEKMNLAEEQRKSIIKEVKEKYGRDPAEIEKEIKERGKFFF